MRIKNQQQQFFVVKKVFAKAEIDGAKVECQPFCQVVYFRERVPLFVKWMLRGSRIDGNNYLARLSFFALMECF